MRRSRFLLLTRKRSTSTDSGNDFPQVALLDDFNRANAATLGVNWTADPLSFDSAMPHISGGAAIPAAENTYTEAGFNGFSATDVDIAYDIASIPAIPEGKSVIYACYARTSGGDTGYWLGLQINKTGGIDVASVFGWRYMTSAALLIIDFNLGIVPSEGDAVGWRVRGTTITAYVRYAGVWSEIHSISNSDITDAGGVALSLFASSTVSFEDLAVDNFSAGTLS